MQSQYYIFKTKAIDLRKTGKTYGEIKKKIGKPIPKSTLSHWFRNIVLPETYWEQTNKKIIKNIEKARTKALAVNRMKRERYIREVKDRVKHLSAKLKEKDVAKIALAMLFLGEGSKTNKGSLVFGNSDPTIIRLFMNLLRKCYNIDKNKFRCTLQCRADQNIKKLEQFWSQVTEVSLSQFYKARIDPRTIGKLSKNLDYKGVCRIDCFSADIFNELTIIGKLLCTVDINNFKNANY